MMHFRTKTDISPVILKRFFCAKDLPRCVGFNRRRSGSLATNHRSATLFPWTSRSPFPFFNSLVALIANAQKRSTRDPSPELIPNTDERSRDRSAIDRIYSGDGKRAASVIGDSEGHW